MRANARPGEWTEVSGPPRGGPRRARGGGSHRRARRPHPWAPPADGRIRPTFALLSESSTDPAAAVPIPPARDRWRQVEVRQDALRLPIRRVPRPRRHRQGVRRRTSSPPASWRSSASASLSASVAMCEPQPQRTSAIRSGPAWPVGIAHTAAALDDGPTRSSTSSTGPGDLPTAARRWVRGGREWHHYRPPHRPAVARGPWRTVTAVGHTAVAANTASTAAIVPGAGPRGSAPTASRPAWSTTTTR